MLYKGHNLALRARDDSGHRTTNRVRDTDVAAYATITRDFGLEDAAQSSRIGDVVLQLTNHELGFASDSGMQRADPGHGAPVMTQNKATLDARYELNIHVSSLKFKITADIIEEVPAFGRFGRSLSLKLEEPRNAPTRTADLAPAPACRSPVKTADIIDTCCSI